MRRSIFTALSVVIAVGLAGCSSAEDSKDKLATLVKPKAGQCIAKEMKDGKDLAPDMNTVVACNKPHVFEIIKVIDVPRKFLKGKDEKARLANRADLTTVGDDKTARAKALSDTTQPECALNVNAAAGLGGIRINDVIGSEAGLRLPESGAGNWSNLSSPALWKAGDTKVICSVRFTDRPSHKADVDPAKAVVSPDARQLVTHMFGDENTFPVSLRQCVDTKKDAFTSCTATHDAEVLWGFDIAKVFGKKLTQSQKAGKLNDDQEEQVRNACSDPAEKIYGKQFVDNWDWGTIRNGPTYVKCVILPFGDKPMKPGFLLG